MPALFVLPTLTSGQLGPVASYLSTAGWAAASDRVLGESWILCPEGVIDAAEARRRGSAPTLTSGAARRPSWRRRVPEPAKTLVKDARAWYRSRQFEVGDLERWRARELDLVWQRHELFQTAGIDLARRLGRPSVLFAPTTKVWEAQRWGTVRPGWSGALERVGESPALRQADVVACGSTEVAEQAVRLGARPERVLVVPTGVDLDQFPADHPHRAEQRTRLGLEGRFVVGWVGSFRPFHALDRAVDALAGLDDVALLLVGDGPQRGEVRTRAAERGVMTVTTGTVPHHELPSLLAAMDAGVVVGPADGAFHYSPLKLAEYLAAGLAVIAPDVATVRERVTDGHDALLVPPADDDALRQAVRRLRDDPALVAALGRAGRRTAEERLSWDVQVRRVRDAAARVDPT